MGQSEELAYTTILTGILNGDFEPGGRLREEELADHVGVSRTPIREALRRLHGDGFVEFRPNQGAWVHRWEASEADEIFQIRSELEGRAAGLAAERGTRSDINHLRDLAEEMAGQHLSDPNDRIPVGDLNRELHDLVLQMAESPQLSALTTRVRSLAMMYLTFRTYSDEQLQRSLNHHFELAAAISARDALWAESVMRTHVLAARSAMVAQLLHVSQPDPP